TERLIPYAAALSPPLVQCVPDGHRRFYEVAAPDVAAAQRTLAHRSAIRRRLRVRPHPAGRLPRGAGDTGRTACRSLGFRRLCLELRRSAADMGRAQWLLPPLRAAG